MQITCHEPAISFHRAGVLRDGRWVLSEISTTIQAGTCAVVVGPNGSGKSTLARVTTGYLWPTAGEVTVLGERFGETPLPELRRRIRLIQPTGIAEPEGAATAYEVILTGFFGTAYLYDQVDETMRAHAMVGLDRVRLSHVANQRYDTLSTGERMRCLIARALVTQPELLILDEPTAGLDLVAREQVLEAVDALAATKRVTLMLITHHIEDIPSSAAQVLLLRDGRLLADGTPEQVLCGDVLTRAYGCPIRVDRVNGRFFATAAKVPSARI